MRVYEVQPKDTPATIAAEHAGCPKCSRDLIAANPKKPTVTYPNGFKTFRQLFVGEKLALPDKWFSKEFDNRSPAYFAALPHPDGVTPSKLGVAAAGVLGDFAAYDAATLATTALAQLSDQQFSIAANAAAELIDQSVQEADSSSNPGILAYAQATHIATNAARQRNAVLIAALVSGDQATATQARLDIQNDLLTATDAAQLALQAVYGSQVPTPPMVPLPPIPVPPLPKILPIPKPLPTPTPAPAPAPASTEQGLSTGAIVGISALGAGVVGTGFYLLAKRAS